MKGTKNMKRKVNSATSRRKKEWEAYQQILQIALPIMVQNLFSAAISSADVIMLNSVGYFSRITGSSVF